MDSSAPTFTLRFEADFDWERGLSLYDLNEFLTTFGQALQAHYLEGVRTGEFEPPSEHFPPVWLTWFALLEFETKTQTAVLAPPTSSEFRREASLALDNLASLLDAFTEHTPLLAPEARALHLAQVWLGEGGSYEISTAWGGKNRRVRFDERSLGWLEPLVRRLDEEEEYVYVSSALPSLRTETRSLHWASQETKAQLTEELARLGFAVCELDGSRMTAGISFYEEGARAGLANPMSDEWDFEPTVRTAIVWSHADEAARSEPQTFVEHVAEILRRVDRTDTQVDLFLLGDADDVFPLLPSHPTN